MQMVRAVRFFGVFLAVLLVGGCGADAPVVLLPNTVTLKHFSDNGTLEGTLEISSANKEYVALEQFLRVERSGWQRSYVSYADKASFRFEMPGTSISVHAHFVVIDQTVDGNSISLEKHMQCALRVLQLDPEAHC
jgi:hypothetical protein